MRRALIVIVCAFLALLLLVGYAFHDRRPRIYFAVESGDTNAIARYLAQGHKVNDLITCYPFGEQFHNAPLLDVALENGQRECVEFLLNNGARPDAYDSHGDPPILWIIGRTKNDVPVDTRVQLLNTLLRAGADPNRKSTSGFWTPLIFAADLGQTELLKRLLAAGADIHLTNSDGLTAIHFADNADIARLLIHAGANPTNRSGGETPAETMLRLGKLNALAVITNSVAKQ